MYKYLTSLLLLVFGTHNIVAQNSRDFYIQEYIVNIQNSKKLSEEEKFNTLLKNIEKLEKDYKTYEAEFRFFILLERSFNLKKLFFFKKQLSILVEKYGFQVIYMTENESYYKSIMKGELSVWFKEMYLKKHLIWLTNNFEKQIDLKKLNNLHEKDQLINKYSLALNELAKHDSLQIRIDRKLKSEYSFANAGTLHLITQKYNALPTAKTFALVQNNYTIVEFHNLQLEDNFERYYMLFFEYYKKAYLANQIENGIFSHIDFNSFVHYNNQIFGLITKQNILDSNLTDKEKHRCPDIIPLRDPIFTTKIKKEFKWY